MPFPRTARRWFSHRSGRSIRLARGAAKEKRSRASRTRRGGITGREGVTLLPIFGRRLSRDPFGRKLSVVASHGMRGNGRNCAAPGKGVGPQVGVDVGVRVRFVDGRRQGEELYRSNRNISNRSGNRWPTIPNVFERSIRSGDNRNRSAAKIRRMLAEKVAAWN